MITTEKFRIRRLAVVGVVMATAVGLGVSGCSDGAGGGGNEDVLAKIKKTGTINVGACLSVPPYGLIDSSGKPAGFDVEVAQQLAEFLNVKVNVVDVNVASRIPSLQSQKLDLISCNFTINDERKKQIDYSDVMMLSGNSLLVRKDSGLSSVKDLKGHTVAVSKGGTSVTVAKENAPDAVQQPYETFASAVLALKQGQADAVIDIGTSVSDAAVKNSDLTVAVDGEVGPKVQFGLGVQKGQQALLTQVNAFVKKFHEEGRGKALFAKWAGVKPTFQFEGLEK